MSDHHLDTLDARDTLYYLGRAGCLGGDLKPQHIPEKCNAAVEIADRETGVVGREYAFISTA
jgi:hypothetical protein